MTDKIRHFSARSFRFLCLFLCLVPALGWSLAQELETLKPNRAQAITSIMVVKQLQQAHYNRLAINTDLSSRVFDRYLEEMDRNRSYFTAEDIREFERYRFQLDKALQSGNLAPAFLMYNRYQERLVDRLNYALAVIDNELENFDFSKDEYYQPDRRELPWAKDTEELNALWQRRIKYLVLNSVMADKTLEETQEALSKRFRNQLNRALQVNSDDAFQYYLNAVTHTFDPHTQYLPPRDSENFNINMSLQLQGIGAVLQAEDEYTKVIRLIRGGPADRSRQLKPADRIVGVGQGSEPIVDVVGWRLDDVVQLIRGEKGTKVRLEVIPSTAKSESETRIINLERDTVKLEDRAAQKEILTIEEDGKTQKLGVISVPAFYADYQGAKSGDKEYRSTTRDVARLIAELQEENIDGLIIDLRNNGGGFLEEANALVGLFIETGPTVQVRYTTGRIDEMRDTDPRKIYDGPLAVLVNRLSASASEIFAGAIQDYQRGVVIGEATFGKGTVQALQTLDRGQLKITQAMFYRISGKSNQHSGVIPDVTMPSLIDADEIGESALENALPAGQIRPASFTKEGDIARYVNFLRAAHDVRSKDTPDLVFLTEKIALLETSREKNRVSLNKAVRLKEKAEFEARRLAIENTARTAKGEKPFKTFKELVDANGTDEEAMQRGNEEGLEIDFVITEAGHILRDLMALQQEHSARIAKQ